jgi:hypothetical protein
MVTAQSRLLHWYNAPDQGTGRMVPAIGSVGKSQAEVQNQNQETYFADASRLPVAEINTNNTDLFNSPRFFDGIKPVQSVVAQALLQQGLITDNERGTINSSSQRESPVQCLVSVHQE